MRTLFLAADFGRPVGGGTVSGAITDGVGSKLPADSSCIRLERDLWIGLDGGGPELVSIADNGRRGGRGDGGGRLVAEFCIALEGEAV